MQNRLPRLRERAAAARRMRITLHSMAAENAAEDATIGGVLDRLLAAGVFAGGGTVVVLWQGAAPTLGHVLVIAVGVIALADLLWQARERRGLTT